MIGSPAPPSWDDLTGLLYATASFWPPPWLNIILAAAIGIVWWYCKQHIINVSIYIVMYERVVM